MEVPSAQEREPCLPGELRTAFYGFHLAVLQLDQGGSIRYANPRFLELTGYEPGEITGRSWFDFLDSAGVARCGPLFQMPFDDQTDPYRFEANFRMKDGMSRNLIWNRTVFPATEERPGCMVLMGEDTTERNEREEELMLFSRIFNAAIEGMMVTDSDGIILRVNAAFTKITGFTAEEAIGKKPSLLRSGLHEAEYYTALWDRLIRNGHWEGEIWDRRKNGTIYPEWLTITAIQDDTGVIRQYAAIFHDISELKKSQEAIEHQAHHDPLTGLPNRILLLDRLKIAVRHAKRTGGRFAVFYLDLDNFKGINELLGHETGDRVLQHTATLLRNVIRDEDTVGRIGGDEFVLLMESIHGPEDTVHLVQRIRESMQDPVRIGENEFFLSPTIGISVYPVDGEEPEELMRNADTAMYRAKEEGRNSYQHYAYGMSQHARKRLMMENRMRRALEREEIQCHYQPKLELETGRITGMEALMRWNVPEEGFVAPSEFVPIAEETGMIAPLGDWILLEACRFMRRIVKEGFHTGGFDTVRVAVNLSVRQFEHRDLIQRVGEILKESEIPPEALELEITESVIIRDVDRAISQMRRLSDMGVRISIDDFGTGYSSLSYLKKFPIDSIKIDRSFILDIPENPDDVAITMAILSMAKSLNLRVVAEGVETRQQLDFLLERGCDEIQGYIISEPLPSEGFLALIKERRKLDKILYSLNENEL